MSSISEAEMDPRLTFFIRGPRGAGKSALLNAMFAQGINAVWAGSSPLTINVSKEKPEESSERPEVLDFAFGALGGVLPLVDALKYRFVATSGEEETESSALYAQYTKHARYVCL
jgi:hypothetical protein